MTSYKEGGESYYFWETSTKDFRVWKRAQIYIMSLMLYYRTVQSIIEWTPNVKYADVIIASALANMHKVLRKRSQFRTLAYDY